MAFMSYILSSSISILLTKNISKKWDGLVYIDKCSTLLKGSKLKGYFKETVTTILHMDNGSALVNYAHMGYKPLRQIKSGLLTCRVLKPFITNQENL